VEGRGLSANESCGGGVRGRAKRSKASKSQKACTKACTNEIQSLLS